MIKGYISQLTLYSFFHRQNTESSSSETTLLPDSINAFSIRRKLSLFFLSVEDLSAKLFVVCSFIYSFKHVILAVKTVAGSVLKNLMYIQLVSVHRYCTDIPVYI